MEEQLQPRQILTRSRVTDFFDPSALERQTGLPWQSFASVIMKELCDNALDACETVPVAPEITIAVRETAEGLCQIAVSDNGAGMAPETIAKHCDFTTWTSDKAAYRSPTRGAQGNALKTVLGIPYALGQRTVPILIETRGVQHQLLLRLDEYEDLDLQYQALPSPRREGTRVTITIPLEEQEWDLARLAQGVALFNPHVAGRISVDGPAYAPWSLDTPEAKIFPTVPRPFPATWRKYIPGDPTSVWWYTASEFEALIKGLNRETRKQGDAPRLRDFVGGFKNLTAKEKTKEVCEQFPHLPSLRDFVTHPEATVPLYQAMRQTGKPPSPRILGAVGEAHFQACFEAWYDVHRFWFHTQEGLQNGIPCVIEVAIAEVEGDGDLWTGINFSPTYKDPWGQVRLQVEGVHYPCYGLRSCLQTLHVPWVAPPPEDEEEEERDDEEEEEEDPADEAPR
jgi:DNA topoisomerase VI subunit B